MSYNKYFLSILKKLWDALVDLIPIIVVVVFFQSIVIREPFPQIGEVIFGIILVILGLMLFIEANVGALLCFPAIMQWTFAMHMFLK